MLLKITDVSYIDRNFHEKICEYYKLIFTIKKIDISIINKAYHKSYCGN